jgi:hypothetical protein
MIATLNQHPKPYTLAWLKKDLGFRVYIKRQYLKKGSFKED